jgi:hypothetical protein
VTSTCHVHAPDYSRHLYKGERCLENAVQQALPSGPSGHLSSLPVDEVPIELTATSVDIHLGGTKPSFTLPEVPGNPERGDNEDGKIRREEVRSRTKPYANRRHGGVELGF